MKRHKRHDSDSAPIDSQADVKHHELDMDTDESSGSMYKFHLKSKMSVIDYNGRIMICELVS